VSKRFIFCVASVELARLPTAHTHNDEHSDRTTDANLQLKSSIVGYPYVSAHKFT